MKIVLQINGGIGKSIIATAVCKAIKRHYPDSELIVLTGYNHVFLGNPNVDRVLDSNNLNYFYKDHIKGQPDTRLFLSDPYIDEDFVHRRGHLIETWCKMCGIPYNGEMPELFITANEMSSFGQMFRSPKPILAIQTNGGVPNQTDKYSWPRDLPLATAQRVVDAFVNEYNVVHIRRQDQLALNNVYPVTADFRQLAVLIAMSSKRLFIDSFAQHVAAALRLPSVVCWIANVPSQFGYAMHTNIMSNPFTRKPDYKNSILSEFNIIGPPSEFPYNNEHEIFNADQLIEVLRGSNQPATVKENGMLAAV